ALVTEPEMLLLDEPLAALDAHLRYRLQLLLAESVRSFPGITLLVTHDLEEAFRICDDLAVMDAGRVVAFGEKHAVFDQPGRLSAALVTGCKNVTRVQAHAGADDLLAADAWGVNLRVPTAPATPSSHVGIRAHHVELAPLAPAADAG